MKYNFTNGVRHALAKSRDEAIGLKHDYVGTEHMLLGLLWQSEDVGMQALRRLRIDASVVREQIAQRVRPGHAASAMSGLPYTSRAKKALELAMTETRALKHGGVGTEHLLLGLLREEKGIAAQSLNELGVTVERARAAVLQVLSGEPGDAALGIEIDDASDVSIYEQIVGRVEEAIATGELAEGERLPPVRRLADELDIAPGTVARSYSELERRGVVVTDGARGTRVAKREAPAHASVATPEILAGLMRPVVVAAFHMGARAQELRAALESAMKPIY